MSVIHRVPDKKITLVFVKTAESRCRKMCEVVSFKNFENSLTTVKVMRKTKVAPFYLGHGVLYIGWADRAGNLIQYLLDVLTYDEVHMNSIVVFSLCVRFLTIRIVLLNSDETVWNLQQMSIELSCLDWHTSVIACCITLISWWRTLTPSCDVSTTTSANWTLKWRMLILGFVESFFAFRWT